MRGLRKRVPGRGRDEWIIEFLDGFSGFPAAIALPQMARWQGVRHRESAKNRGPILLPLPCWLSRQIFVTRLADCTSQFRTVMAIPYQRSADGTNPCGSPGY